MWLQANVLLIGWLCSSDHRSAPSPARLHRVRRETTTIGTLTLAAQRVWMVCEKGVASRMPNKA